MAITLNEILTGTSNTETVYIESLDDEIKIRYLSQSEISEIEKIEAKALGTFETQEKANRNGRRQQGGTVQSTAKINLAKQTEASNQAKLVAVSLSCSVDGEEYSTQDVAALPSNVFKELYEKIQEINKLSDENLDQEVDEFLENQ